MSITLMTAAFKTELPATQKFVFVALCDNANDQGECYPSIQTLMVKCSLTERPVQKALVFLEQEGFLRRSYRTGRATIYQITQPDKWEFNPRPKNTPVPKTPPYLGHPTPVLGTPQPPYLGHPTPVLGTPITINEPSIEPSVNQKKAAGQKVSVNVTADDMVNGCPDLTKQVATEYLGYRKAKGAHLTPLAWSAILKEIRRSGLSADDALAEAMARGWQGFKSDWLQRGSQPASRSKHDLSTMNYNAGVTADGSF